MTTADNLMQACVENRREAGVPVGQWADVVPFEVAGITVHLRAFTPAELAAWFQWWKGATPAGRRRLLPAIMFTSSVCDELGRRLYAIEDAERVAREFNPRVLAAVTTRAMEVNRM